LLDTGSGESNGNRKNNERHRIELWLRGDSGKCMKGVKEWENRGKEREEDREEE
jgi:hypothetical protein